MRASPDSDPADPNPTDSKPADPDPADSKPADCPGGETSGLETSDREAPPWWKRLARTLRAQWIFAALLGISWGTELLVITDRDPMSPLMVPGFTLMALTAVLAWSYPVSGGLAGAAVLAGSSALAYALEIDTYSLSLATILPTENLSGLLMVLYLFWKRPLRRAIPVTVVLVVTCVLSVWVRVIAHPDYPSDPNVDHVAELGLLQLALAVGAGLYLAGRHPRTTDTPMQALMRRQSPVTALLVVILFFELLEQERNLPLGFLIVLGCAVMAGLAVFAPMRPVEAALLGALALALTAVVARVVGVASETYVLGPIPLTATASGMLLLAFAARHAPKRQVLWVAAALTLAALFALVAIPSRTPSDDLNTPVIVGGLLLIL